MSTTKEQTEKVIADMLENLEGLDMGRMSLDGLKDALSAPGATESVAELMEIEAQTIQQGENAPDFTLPFLPGSGEGAMTLSHHFGKRPVALVFGSYT